MWEQFNCSSVNDVLLSNSEDQIPRQEWLLNFFNDGRKGREISLWISKDPEALTKIEQSSEIKRLSKMLQGIKSNKSSSEQSMNSTLFNLEPNALIICLTQARHSISTIPIDST